ncbi:hypothetical protein PG987_013872 [Apiospora arundinis]
MYITYSQGSRSRTRSTVLSAPAAAAALVYYRYLCVRTRYHHNQNHNLGPKRSHRLRRRRVHFGRPLHLGGGECNLKHSDNPYDENLALGCANATSCVEAWGNEHREYNFGKRDFGKRDFGKRDFGKRDFGESTGHSTQLVWKYTTSVGCGACMCGVSDGNYDGDNGSDAHSRGFAPRIPDVEDMANTILATRDAIRVGTRWASNFVKWQPQLKTRLSRVYDYQRALCEDPKKIAAWFELFRNIRAKYGILDEDLYNFDETGFMMGQIASSMVVTGADRDGKRKKVQPGNREWTTAIQGVCADGWCVPPSIAVKGKIHLANWYADSTLPRDWVIKPTSNGWTDNETGLDWIRHFDKHTAARTKGTYRMLVIDGHESHVSAEFQAFCKEKNIITVSMPPHSSHLLQPLDVGCFGPLKRAYGREIEGFMKSHINHITKVEFLIAFRAAFSKVFTPDNVKAGFRRAGLVPLDPDRVISKLDVKLSTPSPTGSLPAATIPWASQTPHNPTEATSQTDFIKSRVRHHQGSSPTPILSAVDQIAKGTMAVMHELALLKAENRTLREANTNLAKRRRAKKTHGTKRVRAAVA